MQSKRAFGKNPLNTIQKHNPETHPVLPRPHALQTHSSVNSVPRMGDKRHHEAGARCQHSPSRMPSSCIAASRAARVPIVSRGAWLDLTHTKGSVRPVSLSHLRPSVRRALSCAGPYGAKRGMCRGLSHPRLSCSFYRVPSSRPAVNRPQTTPNLQTGLSSSRIKIQFIYKGWRRICHGQHHHLRIFT